MTHIEMLVSHAGVPLAECDVSETDFGLGPRGTELGRLLMARNGFFCFLSALHVFPVGDAVNCTGYDFKTWNEALTWRNTYPMCDSGVLFFAEDVFGCQFGIADSGVISFDAETGDSVVIAQTLEDWAGLVLQDSRTTTGWPLAESWQSRFGSLGPKQRLIAKVPFVLGGKFEVENLAAVDAVEGMRLRGDFSSQITDVPDGTEVSLKIVR